MNKAQVKFRKILVNRGDKRERLVTEPDAKGRYDLRNPLSNEALSSHYDSRELTSFDNTDLKKYVQHMRSSVQNDNPESKM